MSKRRYPKPPLRFAGATSPDRRGGKVESRFPGHYGDPAMRRPDRPSVSGGIRRAALPILFTNGEQTGHIVGAHTLAKPPKGSDGCTVRSLDYIGKFPDRS